MVSCASPLCSAAQEDPLFHRISLEQGLSDGRVSSIVQDKYGFMWFGTAAGLNRYDGYNIKVYGEGERGLRRGAIASMLRSKSGALWVSDGKGLLQYNYKRDSLIQPLGIDSSDVNRKEFYVTLMTEDAQGRLYLGCREGLFRYTPATALVEDLNELTHTGGKIKHVSGFAFGKDGRLWITTQKQGFFVLDLQRNSWEEIPHDRQYKRDSCCYAIHRIVFLDDERLLLGQHSFGLTVFNTRTRTFTPQPGLMGLNDSVRFNAVYRLIKDYKGRVWGGTEYFGLIQYLPSTRGVIQYRHDPFNPFSYGGYRVFALYEDREHNIWVGTGGYGVYRFHPDKNIIRYFAWNPVGNQSPPGTEVISAAPRDATSMWIGTDKGPAIFNFKEGTFKAYRYENTYSSTLPGTFVNCIYTDKTGMVWFASRSLGIARFDPVRQIFQRIFKPEQDLTGRANGKAPIPANTVMRVTENPDGGLLFLIGGRRIAMFNPVTFTSRYHTDDSSRMLLRLKDVDDMLLLGRRLLVITHAKGVASLLNYSFDKDTVVPLVVFDSASKTRINRMELMADGNLTLATTNGLYIVSRSGSILRHYTWAGEAVRNRFLAVITGIPGYLWACTDRHIGRVDVRTGEWLWLSNSEGLKPTRFFGEAFKLTPDGKIMAGSGDGLFLINPASLRGAAKHHPVLVNFKVSGNAFPMDVPLQDAKEIHLTHEQNFFSFGMSTLHFGENSNTEYGYKLEGFDRDWQEAGSDRTGQYTGISGGTYTLLLRARSGSAEWVVSPQKVRIVVSKPWWGTWLFRILLAATLAGAVIGVYLYRVRGIRKEERLRTAYEIRLNELETSALRTQMNPHFIFNCLNTINSYINSNQKTEANHYITRFAKLIRLILENSRKRRVALTSDLEALELYFQLERLRFEDRFTYSIEVASDIDADNIEVPPLVLQPFVENAILHGILPADRVGNIVVRIKPDGAVMRYIIEDDGIGREEAARRQRAGALKKESHGMGITMKRIELFNREEGVEAQVRIEDLTDEAGKARGTRVVIPLAMVEGF